MPLVRCQKDGKSGWGVQNVKGSCFVGNGAKRKALRQLAAVEISKHQRAKADAAKPVEFLDALVEAIAANYKEEELDNLFNDEYVLIYDSLGRYVAGNAAAKSCKYIPLSYSKDRLVNVEWPIKDD